MDGQTDKWMDGLINGWMDWWITNKIVSLLRHWENLLTGFSASSFSRVETAL